MFTQTQTAEIRIVQARRYEHYRSFFIFCSFAKSEIKNADFLHRYLPISCICNYRLQKRHIICKNERQARKDEATRNAILQSLEEKLRSGAKSLIGNKGFKKYLAVKKNSVTIDKKKIEEEKRFDGKWVLITNTGLPASDVALQYKELWQVEQVFYAKYILMQSKQSFRIAAA